MVVNICQGRDCKKRSSFLKNYSLLKDPKTMEQSLHNRGTNTLDDVIHNDEVIPN